MKLEENMYVRTKYGISQYKYYDTTNGNLLCIPVKDGSRGIFANIEDIVKASFNIADIIEKGDYINGVWVNDIINGRPIHEDYNDPYYSIGWDNEDIKTIITHEQMEQMSYRVGE